MFMGPILLCLHMIYFGNLEVYSVVFDIFSCGADYFKHYFL